MPDEKYEVGEKVLYRALFNNPGHHKSGDIIPGTIIVVFGNPPIYRIELNAVWAERMIHFAGKKIIVGNVTGRFISKPSAL